MRNAEKNEREPGKSFGIGGVAWYRKRIVTMVHMIEDEKFLNQILTILKKHMEKRGS